MDLSNLGLGVSGIVDDLGVPVAERIAFDGLRNSQQCFTMIGFVNIDEDCRGL